LPVGVITDRREGPMTTTAHRTGARCAAWILSGAIAVACPGFVRAAAPGPAGEPGSLDVPPGPPRDLRVEASGEAAVWVKWSPSDDDEVVIAYEVFRGGTLATRTRSLSITDTGLSPAARTCYSVRAVDAAGRTSPPTPSACVNTPDLTPPETPSAPVVVLDSPTSASVSWAPTSDNVGVVGYELLRGGRVLASVSGLRGSDGALRPTQTVCYSIRALDRAGNRSPPSASACVTPPDVTPPGAPAVVAIPGPRTVTLVWSPAADDTGVTGYEVLRGGEVVFTTRSLEASLGDLPAGRHCFGVRASDAAGNRSTPVEACGVVPDTTPPSTPAAPGVSAPGETSVVLRWSPSTDDVGVTGYEVARDGRVIARSTEPAAGDEGLLASTAHCYTVRARDAAGNLSDPSPPACVVTPDLTPPTSPAPVVATPLSDRSLRVAWIASTDNVGVAGYEVLREGLVVARSTEPSAEVKGLAPGRDYCVEVRAFDAAGHRSSHASPACAHTPDLTPPSAPGGIMAAATSSSRVSVVWSPSTDDVGVAGYEIRREGRPVARSGSTAWLESSLAPAAEYCYDLRAFDAAGNLSDPSPTVCTRTTPPGTPAAPVDLRVEPAGPRSLALSWQPSPDPGVVYAVFWDGEKRIGSTRYLTYKVDGLKPGQRRCFQVAAIDERGNTSPMTWAVCGATPPSSSAAVR
jgi:chitodextrinase